MPTFTILGGGIPGLMTAIPTHSEHTKNAGYRTHYIINTSWPLGKIAQTGNPWPAGLRNTLFRLIPDRVNASQIKRVLTVDF